MVTIEEVCRSFTEDQLNVLNVLISAPDSEVAKIIESYIRYNAYFNKEDGGILKLKHPPTTEFISGRHNWKGEER